MERQNCYVSVLEFLFLSVGSYFDLKDQEIPVNYLILFGMLGVVANMIGRYQSAWESLAGGCIGCVFLLVGWITKEAIGYGDGWALVILGVIKGWYGFIPIVFGAFLLSGIYGIWRLVGLKASRDETIPFYPFMLAASVGVYLI